MVQVARSVLLAAVVLPTLALALLVAPACCCGPDLSGPPGKIAGEVELPGAGDAAFTLYVIDANQFWNFSEASYQPLQLAPAATHFSVTLTPRYYWLAAVTADGSIGMLPVPGYVVVTSKTNMTDANITDWTGRGNYFPEVRHILAVPDPLPLGSPMVTPGAHARATVSPFIPT